jgi:hypothetical protein
MWRLAREETNMGWRKATAVRGGEKVAMASPNFGSLTASRASEPKICKVPGVHALYRKRFSGAGGAPVRPYKLIFRGGWRPYPPIQNDFQGRVGAPPTNRNLFQFYTKNSINSKK